ncbi:MAG: ATP-binding protein [Bacteroidota bacterium]
MSSKEHAINVLRYWALVEELTPPEIKQEYEEDSKQSIQREIAADEDTPWPDQEITVVHERTEQYTWEYTVFLGVDKIKDIRAIINNIFDEAQERRQQKIIAENQTSKVSSNMQRPKRRYGANDAKEWKRQPKHTYMLAFKVDADGIPLSESLMIPDYVVALGYAISQQDPTKLAGEGRDKKEKISKQLKKAYHHFCEEVGQTSIDFSSLDSLLQNVLKIIHWEEIADGHSVSKIIAHGRQIPSEKQGKDNPLFNSLAINYINDAIKKWEEDPNQISRPLQQYLAPKSPEHREDLTNNSVLRQYVSPQYLAPARWPCAGDFPLSISQQAAVNLALNETSGIFSVNGPPGTGKTTLLNDIISNIIVKRAEVIAQLNDPTEAFEQEPINGENGHTIWKPKSFLQGYEIVIVSNNNEAVENISKAIPQSKAVDSEWELDYFANLANDILDISSEAWGLCAATLGKRYHIDKFFNKFWQEGKKAKGFNHWLLAHLNNNEVTKQKLKEAWEEAKQEFQNTLKGYKDLRKKLVEMEQLLTEMQQLQHEQAESEKELGPLVVTGESLEKQQYEYSDQLNHLRRQRPSWWSRLWANKQYRQWKAAYARTLDAQKAAQEISEACKTQAQSVSSRLKELTKKHNELQQKASNQEEDFTRHKERMDSNFPDSAFWQQPTEVLQQSTPWHSNRLHELRGELFVKAMNLYRAFIGRTAEQFYDNLNSIKALVAKRENWPQEEEVLPALWTSLFTVVPVISTTLASIGNLKGLGKEAIGWVLIDEAGQAAPQAAVGTLQRAKRVIAVGDPQQTPPIVTTSEKMSEVFLEQYHLDGTWNVHNTSVQQLADRVNIFGTSIDTTWIGAPLRVHRRCQNPMFKVANQIAYNGLMVQATPTDTSSITRTLKDKAVSLAYWVDIKGYPTNGSNGHWIPEEGDEVFEILSHIRNSLGELPNLYVISPFSGVVTQMQELLRKQTKSWVRYDGTKESITDDKVYAWIDKSVGTIHKFQGKEADGVILMLGASHNPAARRFVYRSPNILNVALTRSKDFFLVVGDRNVWSQHDYFKTLARELPVQQESHVY